MRILLCGADGFLGRHIESALAAAGHQVLRGVRTPSRPSDIALDYRRDLARDAWLPRLDGIDVVINAIGILNEGQAGDFERIHHLAPAALFAACARQGVRVIQISALGADRRDTPYLASKAAADDCLLATTSNGLVVRPSLVFGPDGASSRFFLALASLPFVFLPGKGKQALQPIHIDDLAALVVQLVDGPPPLSRIVEAVGSQQTTYSDLLNAYRQGMGFTPATRVPLPVGLMATAAVIGDHFAGSLLNRATWSMLQAGNTADADATSRLLGRPARAPADFISPHEAPLLRYRALADWRQPLLRTLLGFLWLWSAAVSLLWPQTGLALLAPFGLAGTAAIAALVAASALDAVLGWLSLMHPGPRLWQVQLAVIAAYSLLVALRLPDFLIHPFAPIAKNLAVVAVLFLLWAEETSS
jgi:uncharacterized protein YbjT (DUF2867 family)